MTTRAGSSNDLPPDLGEVLKQLDQYGYTVLHKNNIEVRTYDYVVNGDNVEAITFRPLSRGRSPGLFLIPGFAVTARDYVPHGVRFALEGFSCLAVSQRGFGRSGGKPDYVGPKTIDALIQGYMQFKNEFYVDMDRMGIYGYSRGAMAAALLAVKIASIKATVLAAGIYDFQKAYDETKPVIREAMMRETGMTNEAIRQRSSLFLMKDLFCPVLILHGAKDENVPVNQAYALQQELTRLSKEFEIQTFPDRAHDIGTENRYTYPTDFLQRKLFPQPVLS
ncbi:MAG: prolyl oligopeptidase family serine peptidase [Deltaproteobacteria bacterium]|nr:prolyl oligopeptidase family serine peptidase [Deltaproteobacteria bacterium]